ncbi:hypothetical protein FS749_006104 [Ceratobasidium sp. UAMH 11750]|nr:hypothetical protein FS749_006104 [Ceratobasidium sp. UAMH 11750]
MSDPKAAPAKKSKSKSSRSKQASGAGAPKLKVVIRRLPPNLPEAIFWQSVSQWVTDETVSWKLYVKGKLRTKLNKENTPSRAYVEFLTPEAVIAFNQDYNGHLFRDKMGNESAAVVEYAPFQKVPHATRKPDSKIGTIEADEDYISFLNALNKPAEPTPDINELVAQPAPSAEPTSTPLLDALRAAKESSTIKGYHSHYREQTSQPRTRAQQLEDEQTFNRKAPLLSKSQQDGEPSTNPTEPATKEEKGKEKEGGGGGKKKNRQKAGRGDKDKDKDKDNADKREAAGQPKPPPPHLSKQAPPAQPSSSTSPNRPSAGEPPRPRPVLNARGGLLAALNSASARKSGGRRDASGGTPNPEAPATQPQVSSSSQARPSQQPNPEAPVTPTSPRRSSGRQRDTPSGEAQTPATPLPAGVLAIPASAIPTLPTPASAPEPPTTPGKGRRKNREIPRIDDPGQALPPMPPQRGKGGGGRGRGGRGRGRGGGGASSAGNQPSAPTV